jgi:hypothetical protein
MADKKISALTASTTPLAGTEVLPIVQSGSTVKVSVANLTAGRAVSASSLEAVGNGDLITLKYASDGGGALLEWAKNDGTTLWTIGGGVVERQDELAFRRSSTNVLYLDNSNNVRVPTGNLVIGTTAKGITTGSAIPLGLGVNNTVTAMTIDTASNVGIANTTPRGLLHVGTSASATDIPVPTGNFAIVRAGTYGSAGTGGIQLSGGYGDAGRVAAWQVKAVGGGATGSFVNDLLFTTQNSFSGSETERMRIDASGNVGIGATAAATALLDVQSTTKGVRFPNMTTTQKNAITPSAGTVIFDTTLAKLCVYSGAAWQTVTSI